MGEEIRIMMPCPNWDNCPKKSCTEQMVCLSVEYWAKVHRAKVAAARIVTIPKTILKEKIKHNDGIETTCCVNKRTCQILGQCIFKHPKIIGKHKLIRRLMEAKTIKKYRDKMKRISEIMSITMPTLRRIGNRNYYKPEFFWKKK